MKQFTRIAAVLLALVMVFGMVASAFAAEGNGIITITNTQKDQTYNIYRIFDLESYSGTSYSYKLSTNWAGFKNDAFFTVNELGYIEVVENADAAAFAKAALAYAKEKSIAHDGTAKSTGENVVFENLPLGYYLVDSTVGTLCSLDTTAKNVEIKDKNTLATSDKTVEEDSTPNVFGTTNTADIGQIVNFKSTITVGAGAINYVYHDKMDAGLTLDPASIKVDGAAQAAGTFSVVQNPDDGCTFHIVFDNAFIAGKAKDTQLDITYSATLNENAVIGDVGNKNKGWLVYGESNDLTTTPIETVTKTWSFSVFKYTDANTALANATFKITDSSDKALQFIHLGNNVYRLAKPGENEGLISEITTDSTGTFTLQGLDADTYKLVETAAPAGYNKLTEAITVTIGADGVVADTENNTVKVENKAGALLPSTGGFGTTMFYLFGAMFAIGAGILLVTKRRMNAQ